MVTTTVFTVSENSEEIPRNLEAFMKMVDLIVKIEKNWAAKSKYVRKKKSKRCLKEKIDGCVVCK